MADTIHLVKSDDAVLTYCKLPVIDGHIEYVTLAHALDAKNFKAFTCVDCHKVVTDFARHQRPPEEESE